MDSNDTRPAPVAHRLDVAKLVGPLILTRTIVGRGTPDDMVRPKYQLWTTDGLLVAVHDLAPDGVPPVADLPEGLSALLHEGGDA